MRIAEREGIRPGPDSMLGLLLSDWVGPEMCLPDCFEWLISHSPAPAMVMVNWKSMSMANTPHPPAPAKAPAPAPAPESPQSQRHIIFASACVRHVSPGCAPLLYSFLINLQHAKPMTVPLSACRCRKERNVSGRQTSWAVNFNLYSNDILFLPFSILSRARVTQGPCPKTEPVLAKI